MGYLVELDDLNRRVIYPPRGMEFAPVQAAPVPAQVSQEKKSLWLQEELSFKSDSENLPPSI